MRILTIIKHIPLFFILIISGCSSAQFTSWDDTVFSPAYWNKSMTEQQAKESRLQIEQSLTRKNIEKAQRVILYSRKENISELLLADLYTEVSNRLLQAAEQEATAGRPDKAGKYYRMAHDIYPVDARLRSTINLSLENIDSNIEHCADRLMDNGLAAYRAGELDKAIAIWQGINEFLPNHSPSLIATNTARQQLKNLEMLSSDQPL